MNLKQRYFIVILLGVLIVGLTGCESHRDINPILPGEQTVLVISFSPTPVYESSDGRFHFLVFIDEVNNVGARITSVKLENLDEEGNVVDTDRHDEEWIRRTFGTSYIEPFGRLIGSVELEAPFNSSRETWWLRGTDDNGYSFDYQGSVELISR